MSSSSPESFSDDQDGYVGFVRSYPGSGQDFTSVDTMLVASSFKVIALDLDADGSVSNRVTEYTIVIPKGTTISHREDFDFLKVPRKCSQIETTNVDANDYFNTHETADQFPDAPWAGGLGFVIDDSRAEGTAYWVGGRAPQNPRYDLGPRTSPTPEQVAGLQTDASRTHHVLSDAHRNSDGCAFEPVIVEGVWREA